MRVSVLKFLLYKPPNSSAFSTPIYSQILILCFFFFLQHIKVFSFLSKCSSPSSYSNILSFCPPAWKKLTQCLHFSSWLTFQITTIFFFYASGILDFHTFMKMMDNHVGNLMDSSVLILLDYATTLDNGDHCLLLTLSSLLSSSRKWWWFLQKLTVEF